MAAEPLRKERLDKGFPANSFIFFPPFSLVNNIRLVAGQFQDTRKTSDWPGVGYFPLKSGEQVIIAENLTQPGAHPEIDFY
jgi:hypothetical protein